MKLASITLAVFLLVGLAFPTNNPDTAFDVCYQEATKAQALASRALDAVREAIEMGARLRKLHDPKVDAILDDGLDKMQKKLNSK